MDSRSSTASAQALQSAYRIFIGDADGHLKVLRTLPCSPTPPTTHAHKQPEEQQQQAEEAQDGPQLPWLGIINIDGRRSIVSRALSSTTVNASPDAVQKLAGGRLASGHWVLAIARRDASIDIVLPQPQPEQHSSRHTDHQPQRAALIGTVLEADMRAGMERWVGLHVAPSGVYSCTSAAALRFTPIVPDSSGSAASTSASNGHPSGRLVLGEATTLKLPHAPLSQVIFTNWSQGASHTPSAGDVEPTHFLYGGPDTPLSIWHIPSALSSLTAQGPLAQAISSTPASQTEPNQVDNDDDVDISSLSAKERKRKRQEEARRKAQELKPGEVWRANNLPNDVLNLRQKANIASIVILSPGTPRAKPDETDGAQGSQLPNDGVQVGVATKTGMFRIYAPRVEVAESADALAEFPCLGGPGAEGRKKDGSASGGVKGSMAIGLIKKGVTTGGAEVRLVQRSADGSNLLVADTQGKVYVLDWRAQRVLYQYPNIDGAVTAVVPLPTPAPPAAAGKGAALSSSSQRPSSPLVLTTSLDRIVRLHASPNPASESARLAASHPPGQAQSQGQGQRRGGAGRANAHTGMSLKVKPLVEVFVGALQQDGEEVDNAAMEGAIPAAPTAAVWDGVVPLPLPLSLLSDAGANGAGRKMGGQDGMEVEDDDEEEEGGDGDEMWEGLDRVGEDGRPGNTSAGAGTKGEQEAEGVGAAAAEHGAGRKKKRLG